MLIALLLLLQLPWHLLELNAMLLLLLQVKQSH